MMRLGLAGLAALTCLQLAAACGTTVEAPSVPFTPGGVEPGSRLRPVYRVSDGGAEVFHGWYDRELEEYCQFQPMHDGVERCVPGLSKVVFTDAACTQAALLLGRECLDDLDGQWGGLSTEAPDNSCATHLGYPRVFQRVAGDALAATSFYEQARDGSCSAAATPLQGDERLFAAALDDGSLVSATVRTADGANGLGRYELQADDGAVQLVSARQTELDIACTATNLDRNEVLCVPRELTAVAEARFASADCTAPVARLTCGEKVAVEVGCERKYFLTGEPLTEAFQSGPGGDCRATDAEGLVRLGAAFNPPIISVQERGDGDVIARFATDGNGLQLESGRLHLSDGSACLLRVDPRAPERTVCAPLAPTVLHFRDPSCREPVYVKPACGPLDFKWMAVPDNAPADCGPADYGLVRIPDAPEAIDSVFVRDGDEQCVPSPLEPGDLVFVATGAVLSLSDFPSVRLETR